ncbi:serine hydrolase domain-containing protein [Phenylobacterium soli]|uniref:Serine hydrolase n=1 Tax=Phenylobacterium soli TaxID=2170551 RepID=A0A328AHB2_9CAUL|nr:serine hydrolase [Phenylobacterium soli]RAK54049.1 serine hydrolase [Phenylobacterium soli]
MLRTLLAPVLAFATLPLAGCGTLSPVRAARVPTAMAAHEICSATFVSGQDPERFYREAVAPQVAPLAGLLRRDVDRQGQAVTTSLAGLARSRAVFRGPLGCVIDEGVTPPAVALPRERAPALLAPIAGPAPVEPADPALKAALDRAFAEPAAAPHRWTHAVVIVHDGRIVAERYGPGYGVDTPVHGWSMTKTATNALLGVLVRQGRLSMEAPAPVAAWADPRDPRHAITPDELLRMTSGLKLGQSLMSDWRTAFDPAAQTMFAVPDMAGAAAAAPLAHAPGTSWTYSDGSTAILARIVTNATGGPAGVQAFARREVFDRLGMEDVTLETDAMGSPIGATQMLASARDWARLGLLYLDDGVVGGERILPAGWVAYSTRLTPGSERFGYGAGLWVNGDNDGARATRPHMPAGSFMARGARGQYVVVVPSARLVVVRLGDADTFAGDIRAADRLVGDAVAWANARR